jgi:uncharacterized protein YjdB
MKTAVLILPLLCSVTLPSAAQTGLVAAYNFNEGSGTTVTDASGTGNTGTISGATWSTSGRFGGALSFNGSTNFVTVNAAPSLNLTTAMTVEAWVRLSSVTGWQTVAIRERTGGLSYALYANTDSNAPAGVVSINGDVNLYGTTRLVLNTWTHLATTYDGATLRLYVNGVQVRSMNLTGTMAAATGPLRIGGNAVWGEYLNGLIDELRIYNRALTAAQIQADMTAPIVTAPQNGLTVTPATISLTTFGATQQLTVRASFADNSTQDVTTNPATTYSSSNPAAATVSATGLVTAAGNGNAIITATYGGFSATSSVTVNIPPTVQTGLAVSPGTVTLNGVGTTQQLTVTALYSDGSSQNVSSNAATSYTSGNISVATVSSSGLITAVAAGSATITASHGGFSAAATATVNTTSGPSGLVAAYNFNEGSGTTVTDASGTGNTGTISGATWSTSGRFGGALSFNGSSDWVTVNDSSSLDATSGVTVEAWIYPKKPLGWQSLLMKEGSSNVVYGLYANTAENNAAGIATIGGSEVSVNHAVQDVQVQMYRWTHLAITYNGSVFRLFFNGVEVSSVNRSGSLNVSAGPLRIGGNAVWGEYFNGMIDEVRVYNRALTTAEIQADMNRPINAPVLTSLTLSPSTFTIPVAGATQQVMLRAVYQGGAAKDVTLNNGVTYSSSNPAVATVSATGIVKAVGNGNATITASYGGLSPTAAATVSITNDPAQIGQWSQPIDLGVVAVNMLLMRTGKVLVYGGVITSGKDARVFDPATATSVPVPNNATDLFCSGHATLPDGRILVVGGHDTANNLVGLADVNIFNPVTQQWTSAPKMAYRRWYPTATVLPDGRVLVTSGGQACFAYECLATNPEIYNPASNSWTTLTGAALPFWYYPYTFLLPDGRALLAGSSEQPTLTRVLNLATQTWTTIDPVPVDGGSAVMYAPGKIMKSGTSMNAGYPDTPAANTTYVLDMTQTSPVWRQTAAMASPRAYHTLTMLPDGSVLATGGQETLDGISGANAARQAELWSPTTETWTTLALGQTPRLYHSTAVLMPDARILVGGGGSVFPATDYTSGEYFSPPYLFKGPRPAITTAPATLQYGTSFVVETPDAASIGSIALIRPGNVTHQFNQEATFVNLSFQNLAGSLSVQAPNSGSVAPPGYYMLFLVSKTGVPSVAAFLKIQ